jgi:hypothetical protein
MTSNTKRSVSDSCLLCKNKLATKRNSHILPKFLSTKFLKSNLKHEGFELSNKNISNPKKIQDSSKEDYLFCDDCEKYFGVLETISSVLFNNWKIKLTNKEYSQTSICNDLLIIDCNTINKKTIFLFIYSMYWRASISNEDLFRDFKINPQFEEKLRIELLNFQEINQKEYLNKLLNKSKFKIFPTFITTAQHFPDETANFNLAPVSESPYWLVCDKFSFLLFEVKNDLNSFPLNRFCNNAVNDCKIMIFSERLWLDLIIKPIIQKFE